MIKSELKKLQLAKTIVSIERNCHDEELTGFIASVNDQLIAVTEVSDEGEYIGVSVFCLSQVTELYWGNRVHQAIELLAREEKIPTFSLASKSLKNAATELQQKFGYVSVYKHHEEGSYSIGEIVASDNEWFKLHTYGLKVSLSRKHHMYQWEDISRVSANSSYEEKTIMLHKKGI